MFSQDRTQLRKMFFEAWNKHVTNQTLTPLEDTVVSVINLHPEYQTMLANENDFIDKDYQPEDGESNPFLHMAMHISIHEQLSTKRPLQIIDLYQQLLNKYHHAHTVEHHMMECLGQMVWQAQRDNVLPDEKLYVTCLEKLIK